MIKKSTEVVILSLIVLMSSLFIQSAAAKEFLCDARQESADQLPLLNAACPVGDGIWGHKTVSPSTTAIFWVQCGMMGQPLSGLKAQQIKRQVSSNVWMKKEGRSYRCLVGPYDAYVKALTDLNRLKSQPGYHDSFIRVVGNYSVAVTPKAPSQSAPAVAEKKSSVPELAESLPVSSSHAEPVPAVAPAPASSSESTATVSTVKGTEIRKRYKIGGTEYAVPFLGKEKAQYYMEYDEAWNRLSYQDAVNLCRSLNMHLANTAQWERILSSKVMEKQQWPLYLPYWGSNSHGLFSNGKVRPLKGSSLLNVLCVR